MTLEAPRTHLYLILVLALDTGMRKGEIFSLKRKQINLDNLTISLDAEQTKSFRARLIPISDRLAKLLQKQFVSIPYQADDLLRGGAKTAAAFDGVLEAAGITDVVFHSLRHTAITWMDLAGVSEMVKKQIVGLRPATCMRITTI